VKYVKRGFTLIELLMVIAILGILMSIIVNQISTARSRARDSKRVIEIRQLETAIRAYELDYGSYPVGTLDIAPSTIDQSNNGAFIPVLSPNYIAQISDPGGNGFGYYWYLWDTGIVNIRNMIAGSCGNNPIAKSTLWFWLERGESTNYRFNGFGGNAICFY
jgi:prepilin-type N-terminal cleavage/methylation domain-containing protein